MLTLAVINIFISIIGVKRAFHTKSMIIFVWLIIFYYSITSIVSLVSNYYDVSYSVRLTYALNMTLCLFAFLLSDYCFNRKQYKQIDLKQFELFKPIVITIEIVFWISIVLTYFELRTQDYQTYTSSDGQAGWAQILFQSTSCVLVYFLYKKSWLKVILASALVVGMVASTGVRSLLYFALLPIVIYYINHYCHKVLNVKDFIKVTLPMALLFIVAIYIVNMLRFHEVRLPETELTNISLQVISNGGYDRQGFNSLLQYITGFVTPIINTLNSFGMNIVNPRLLLSPSIPKLNDLCIAQYNAGEAHMPATIFHDLYMSFGYYGAIWGFVVFSWLKVLCDFLQKNIASIFALSSVFGWHIYMLMRGACDGASSGISYSILICLVLYCVLQSYVKRKC